MKTYIAFLRGINVGGHKKVSMVELRDLLTNLGLKNVVTYIQSGNVIFQSLKNILELELNIKKSILNHFGFDVSVIVKTSSNLQAIFEACPFSNEKKEASYFILLSDTPHENLIKETQKVIFENEEVVIKKDCIYFYSVTSYARTKFNMNTYERKLKVSGTSRNFKTMLKLVSLSAEN